MVCVHTATIKLKTETNTLGCVSLLGQNHFVKFVNVNGYSLISNV